VNSGKVAVFYILQNEMSEEDTIFLSIDRMQVTPKSNRLFLISRHASLKNFVLINCLLVEIHRNVSSRLSREIRMFNSNFIQTVYAFVT